MGRHLHLRMPRSTLRDAVRSRAFGRAVAAVTLLALALGVCGGVLSLVGTAASEEAHADASSQALAALYHVHALEASAEGGEPVLLVVVDAPIAELVSLTEATSRNGQVTDPEGLRADVTLYAAAARATVAGAALRRITGIDMGRAASIVFDRDVTDPVFRSLEARLEVASADAKRGSATALRTARWGIGALAAGALLAALVLLRWVARRNRRDAGEHAAAEADLRFRSLVDGLHDQVYLIAPDGEVRYASPAAERGWGGHLPTMVHDVIGAIAGADAAGLTEAFLAGDVPAEPFDVAVRMGHGRVDHFEVQLRDLRADPNVGGVVVTARDVTERRHLEAQLRRQAREDDLTGLANRRSVNAALEGAIGRANRQQHLAALVLVDLDGFKGVNDTLGHPTGDGLLRQAAHRLQAAGRVGETIGRLGGDEFAIVLEGIDGEPHALSAVDRFFEVLREPYEVDGQPLVLDASIGVAIALPGHDAHDLFRHADIALYEAKKSGGNRFALFRPEMEHLVFASARLQRELSTALEKGEIALAYQPVCTIATGATAGFEALMRWRSAALGDVSPMTFIPVAERSGLIGELGRWALRAACRQLADWRLLMPDRRLMMSVNVSVLQVADPTFVDDVRAALAETGVDACDLQLEVTESALADDVDQSGDALAQLRRLGIRIALDDFGTGYSSMWQLQHLPVDCIKIDRSFVSSLTNGGDRALSVVDALVSLGNALGLAVIAEGIEEPAQLEALRSVGCGFAQGYLLARPLTAEAALGFVRERAGDSSR